jgi:hypothetical protein
VDISLPATPNFEPPKELLAFLAHLQITLEATYISSVPVVAEAPQSALLLSPPPRLTSHGKLTTPKVGGAHHPSIFPPSTPNPTPFSADTDRRYLQSEGTLLQAQIWGQDPSEGTREAFSLLWSERNKIWVAVYRLAVTVCSCPLPSSSYIPSWYNLYSIPSPDVWRSITMSHCLRDFAGQAFEFEE